MAKPPAIVTRRTGWLPQHLTLWDGRDLVGACPLYVKAHSLGEFVFDHPFLWGSKRTGPDLHRIGGKYPDAWHYNHLENPRSTSPGSIMPNYPWLLSQTLDTTSLPGL